MDIRTHRFLPRSGRARGTAVGVFSVLAVGGFLLALAGSTQAATSVGLGTADRFAVLAGSGITNTGPTRITGDIGTYPITTITGSTSITLDGLNHEGDAVTQGAKADLAAAYDYAVLQASDFATSADLGGSTLAPGVYTSASSLGLTGTLTLDARGDPDAVFIFQAGSTLTTASSSQVVLLNKAQAANVFWQVGSSATLGTSSTFRGTILALTSITATTGVVVDGRLLARNGAVTLDTNTITRSVPAIIVEETPTPEASIATPTAPASPAAPRPTAYVAPIAPASTPTPPASTAPAVTPTEKDPTPELTPAPEAPQQVPTKPFGGVDTGDKTNG